jgi:hypothetical protein
VTSDVPEFDFTVDGEGRVTPAHVGQFRAYMRHFEPGSLVIGQFYEPRQKRSDRQNRAFHACISPWAKERGWEIDALKQFLLGRVFGWDEFVDPQSGEVFKVLAEPHTSKLSVGQFVTLIDRTLELAAEDGVLLMIGDEYTKAKRAAERQAQKGQAA